MDMPEGYIIKYVTLHALLKQILLCRREIYLGVNNFKCIFQLLKMKNTDLQLASDIA